MNRMQRAVNLSLSALLTGETTEPPVRTIRPQGMHDRWRFNVIGFADDFDNARWLFDNDNVRCCLDDGFGWRWRRKKVNRGLTDNRFGPISGERQTLGCCRPPNRRYQLLYTVRVEGVVYLPASRRLDADSVQRA